MGERPSTARSRELGEELVRVRQAAGFNGNGIAKKLGWERGKVTRVEMGKQAVEEIDLIAWLVACDVRKQEMHRLVGLNRDAAQDIWVQPIGVPSGKVRNLPAEEAHADTISTYALALVPGLLQAEPYIRAICSQLPDEEAEQVVTSRIERQQVLRDPRVSGFEFFIDEQVLRRPIGGTAVMHDQLTRLVFLARWKRNTIRVVPMGVGWHSSLVGSFNLVKRRDKRAVVYVDTRVTNAFYENPEHIKQYEATLGELAKLALSVDESQEFIGALAEEYGCPREDPDDLAHRALRRWSRASGRG